MPLSSVKSATFEGNLTLLLEPMVRATRSVVQPYSLFGHKPVIWSFWNARFGVMKSHGWRERWVRVICWMKFIEGVENVHAFFVYYHSAGTAAACKMKGHKKCKILYNWLHFYLPCRKKKKNSDFKSIKFWVKNNMFKSLISLYFLFYTPFRRTPRSSSWSSSVAWQKQSVS